MYHTGLTDNRIFLVGGKQESITLRGDWKVITSPHKLVLVLRTNFEHYINQLKDVKNLKLRQNFEKRFDKDTS